MISEAERLAACRKAAEDMQTVGLGWHYDAIERLTRPSIKDLAIRAAGIEIPIELDDTLPPETFKLVSRKRYPR